MIDPNLVAVGVAAVVIAALCFAVWSILTWFEQMVVAAVRNASQAKKAAGQLTTKHWLLSYSTDTGSGMVIWEGDLADWVYRGAAQDSSVVLLNAEPVSLEVYLMLERRLGPKAGR